LEDASPTDKKVSDDQQSQLTWWPTPRVLLSFRWL